MSANTSTPKALLALAVIVCTLTLGPAMAHASPGAPERIFAKVDLSDLNLSTPEGARAARARLRKQALVLCWKLADSRSLSSRETVADCTSQALQQALAELSKRASAP